MGYNWFMNSTFVNANLNSLINQTVAGEAVAVFSRAEAMGLFSSEACRDFTLDAACFDTLLESLSQAGVARAAVAQYRAAHDTDRESDASWLRGWFGNLGDVLDDSPIPEYEWGSAKRYFDNDGLARLLAISPASVIRYASGERTTPQGVATRLHWLMLVVGDLLGSYNAFGVRRWFARPRTALGGRSPEDVLVSIEGGWTPEQLEVAKVRELARALTAQGAT